MNRGASGMNGCPMPLWPDSGMTASLTPYLLSGVRPAVLVIPGGGYGCVCMDSEGEPVARRFNELGYHAFVLNYRVAPHRFPAPQQDAVRAMRTIRRNAEAWGVIRDRVAVCGFSAGAHLAGCLGTIPKSIPDVLNDAVDAENGVPDGMILSYGVLCFEPWSHEGSIRNLLGPDPDPELLKRCSLEKQADGDTVPAFIWHTAADQMVAFRNSVDFAAAMAAHGRPFELHLFPFGRHGMLLGLGTRDVGRWPEAACAFLETQWRYRGEGASMLEHYTNEYQCAAEREQMKSGVLP